MIHDIF